MNRNVLVFTEMKGSVLRQVSLEALSIGQKKLPETGAWLRRCSEARHPGMPRY